MNNFMPPSPARPSTISILSVLAPLALLIPILGYGVLHYQPLVIMLATVGFIFLALLLVLSPRNGLLALLIIRPSIDIFGGYSLTLLATSINVASLLSLVVIVWAVWIIIFRRVAIWRMPLFWPLAFFMGVMGISWLQSIAPSATIAELLRISTFFFLYFLSWQFITTEQDFRTFGLALAVSLVAPVALGFWQVGTGTGLTFADSANRAFGTFGHPNVLAFYLVLTLSFFIGFYAAQKSRLPGGQVLLALMSLLLILTGTRSAWLGFLIVLLVLGLTRYRRYLATGCILLIVALMLAPVLNIVLTRFVGFNVRSVPAVNNLVVHATSKDSYQWRIDLWKDMRRRFSEHPVTGFGLGTFPTLRERQVAGFFESTEAHNDYLRVLIELGALGLGAYLLVLGGISRRLVQAYRRLKTTPWAVVPLSLAGFFIAFVFMSFFDNLLQSTPVMWAFLATLGATFRLGTTSK